MTQLTRTQAKKEREKTGIFWWLGQISSWLALFVVLSLVAVMIIIPRAGGATAYTVLTGSMRPDYPPGSLVVVRPVPLEEIQIGDVVTYQMKSGEPGVVTHRVVSLARTLGGEQQFILRGDANNVDDTPVVAAQIRGELWYSMPWLGYVNIALNGKQRIWLTWVAIGGLLTYSVLMFGGAWRDRRGKNMARRSNDEA